VKVWLIDTGPIVAFLDHSDPFHEVVGKALDDFSGQLITTSAVVTEAMHFVAADTRGPGSLVDFLNASRTRIVDCCQSDDLKSAVKLMKKYADTPMDFADGSLVLLGDALGQNHICTLDRRGFSTYRMATGKRFDLVLEIPGR
jgi:predicted nucleic acid-binding protein